MSSVPCAYFFRISALWGSAACWKLWAGKPECETALVLTEDTPPCFSNSMKVLHFVALKNEVQVRKSNAIVSTPGSWEAPWGADVALVRTAVYSTDFWALGVSLAWKCGRPDDTTAFWLSWPQQRSSVAQREGAWSCPCSSKGNLCDCCYFWGSHLI